MPTEEQTDMKYEMSEEEREAVGTLLHFVRNIFSITTALGADVKTNNVNSHNILDQWITKTSEKS